MLLIIIILLLLLFFAFGAAIFIQSTGDPAKRAEMLMQTGDLMAANKLINEQLAKDPEDPAALKVAAQLANLKGDQHSRLLHLETLKRSGRFHSEVSNEELYRQLGTIYTEFGRDEEAFESWLQVLRVAPNNTEASLNIGLMAIGNGEFLIAQKYLEKAHLEMPNEPILDRALLVCRYELGKEEAAFQVAEKLIDKEPSNFELNLLYVLMCKNSHYQSGKNKIKTLLSETSEEHVRRILLRMYMHISVNQQKSFKETQDFLLWAAKLPEMSNSLKTEIHYYRMLLALKTEDYDTSADLYQKIVQNYPTYKRIELFKPYVESYDLEPITEETPQFEMNFQKEFSNLLPQNLVFHSSGLGSAKQINFDKYFVKEENEVSVSVQFGERNTDDSIELLQSYSKEKIDEFSRFAITYLNYNFVAHSESFERGSLDFIVNRSDDNKIKIVFSLRRFLESASISDIFITSFEQKIKKENAQFGVLLTNAQLTSGAESALQKKGNIQFYGKSKVAEIVEAFENAK